MRIGATGEKLCNEEKQRLGAGSVAAERVEVILKEESAGGLGARRLRKQGWAMWGMDDVLGEEKWENC